MHNLPLFPLSSVLLPGGRIALQIFEQRYLDLVRDSMKSSTPFGVVWIRRGEEVTGPGRRRPDLGDHGTCARIVDWDQLPNGLLGITIEGGERFELARHHRADSGLVMGEVEMHPVPEPEPVLDAWQSLVSVLRSLEGHPHVQRMGLEAIEPVPEEEALMRFQYGVVGFAQRARRLSLRKKPGTAETLDWAAAPTSRRKSSSDRLRCSVRTTRRRIRAWAISGSPTAASSGSMRPPSPQRGHRARPSCATPSPRNRSAPTAPCAASPCD